MEFSGIKPENITLVGVLSACSHADLVDEGQRWNQRVQLIQNSKAKGVLSLLIGVLLCKYDDKHDESSQFIMECIIRMDQSDKPCTSIMGLKITKILVWEVLIFFSIQTKL